MFLLLIFLFFSLFGDSPDFNNLKNSKNSIIFLSTKRSGSNLIATSLQIIIKKPIAWLKWEGDFSKFKNNSYNNLLKIPLLSNDPFIFRTHGEYKKLNQIPSEFNKLIFVTRNPKELLFRTIFNEKINDNQLWPVTKKFLNDQMKLFEIYEQWNDKNKILIFYEDFINEDIDLIPKILSFMGEDNTFIQDYIQNKDTYQSMILNSYTKLHSDANGGFSSKDGPKEIFYTKNVDTDLLLKIDEYLRIKFPKIFDKYLKRFKTDI